MNSTKQYGKPVRGTLNGNCDKCLTNTNKRLNTLAEEVYNLRLLLYRTGNRLLHDWVDDDDCLEIGKELIVESRLCTYCDGTGEDGDEDGGSYACYACKGKGVVA
ncbi:MAG: hypothetical protein M0Z43_05355 [Acidithiobacillus sp.]|nr:hypothetical protein [Acidithiobacillus sp.]